MTAVSNLVSVPVNEVLDFGVSFGFKPVPDFLGYDPAVTHVRVEPSGTFAGRNDKGPTSFSSKYQFMLH